MVQSGRDYYQTLGVSPNATEEDIRRAFRRLAMEYHPDRNKSQDAAERFKEVNEAYQVLSDPQKRAQYDRYGRMGVGGGNGFGRGFEGFENLGGFGDIFDAFFSGGFTTRQRASPRRGANLRANLRLTFEEAVFGCEKEVEVERVELCRWCGGNGAEPGSRPVRCSNCRGMGQVRRSQPSIFGQFTAVVTCAVCNGVGQVVTQRCRECGGRGQVRRRRRLAVKIPAGVEGGNQVRLRGEGNAGEHGGRPGDLFITVEVESHRFFQRDQADLLYRLPITIAQAALGDVVEVPTLEGATTLEIPPGTQSGMEFRLRGKGIPRLEGKGRGDLRVVVEVAIPTRLSERQRQLLKELAETLDQPPHPNDASERSWFSRLRDVLSGHS